MRFSLFLSIFFCWYATSQNLSGCYSNELESRMVLQATDDGVLKGTYETLVGDAAGQYPLFGAHTADGNDTMLGWTVAWRNEVYGNSKSATSWTGRIIFEQNTKKLILKTTWLLAQFTTANQAWNGVLTGVNNFTQISCN
jgi:hypothetical protein